MDVSSVRGLITLVIQLHTIAVFSQAVSSQSPQTKSKKTLGDLNPRPSKSCCLNGGLCVLDSFCHCPKKFYGRYCEYELSEKPCGPVPHGSWAKAGCNLCRCFDGHMTCLPRAFDGCDDKPLTEEQPQNIWDYQDEMVIFANQGSTTSKYDAEDADYYDYYDDNGGGDGGGGGVRHSAGARLVPGLCCVAVWSMLCVLVTILWTSWTLVS
nr:EGF-CFC [Crepidula fornicata]